MSRKQATEDIVSLANSLARSQRIECKFYNGKQLALQLGMEVTVEIKAGTRRLIEFFLSPVLRYGNESLRER